MLMGRPRSNGRAASVVAGLVRALSLQETASVVLLKLALDKCQLLDCNIGDRDSRLTGLEPPTPSRPSIHLCACFCAHKCAHKCACFCAHAFVYVVSYMLSVFCYPPRGGLRGPREHWDHQDPSPSKHKSLVKLGEYRILAGTPHRDGFPHNDVEFCLACLILFYGSWIVRRLLLVKSSCPPPSTSPLRVLEF